ncbi:MAG: glycoside hydrolase family 3 protein, partial [Candidatus Korobacteraceae bacterium]
MKFRVLLGLIVAVSLVWAGADGQRYVPGAVQLDSQGDAWAQKTLAKLTLEQKIGQMFVVLGRAQFLNAEGAEYLRLRDIIRKYHIGAIGLTVPVDSGFLQKSMPYEAAMLTNQLQRESELPLLFGADFEYGLTMRITGATAFPYPMAFGAAGNVAHAEAFGRIVAEESRAIGIHWNWFPNADVNSNPRNPIINTRSFGEDPNQVSEMVAAYIRGAHQGGMLTTAKHFPGHGDTSTDTHLGFASVDGDQARLAAVELPPFRAAIRAGVDAVMTAHVTVPALEQDPEQVASTSRRIVTGLLQEEMGFQGLVVTDSLDMNGLMRVFQSGSQSGQSGSGTPSGRAVVASVKAGNDILLFPQNLEDAYNGLLQAVRRGEIPESRINVSVLKILRAKASLQLHKSRLVDFE